MFLSNKAHIIMYLFDGSVSQGKLTEFYPMIDDIREKKRQSQNINTPKSTVAINGCVTKICQLRSIPFVCFNINMLGSIKYT